MEKEIVNKVANSKLEVFDLEDYFPKEEIVILDISKWLFEGFILKEKEFRDNLNKEDWSIYKEKGVILFCSTDTSSCNIRFYNIYTFNTYIRTIVDILTIDNLDYISSVR